MKLKLSQDVSQEHPQNTPAGLRISVQDSLIGAKVMQVLDFFFELMEYRCLGSQEVGLVRREERWGSPRGTV